MAAGEFPSVAVLPKIDGIISTTVRPRFPTQPVIFDPSSCLLISVDSLSCAYYFHVPFPVNKPEYEFHSACFQILKNV